PRDDCVSASLRNGIPLNVDRRGRVKRREKSGITEDAIARTRGRMRYPNASRRAFLARNRPQLFGQPRAFFALVDYERVVFTMSGPRAARYFTEIHKFPVGYVCFLQSKVITHSRRNIEAGAFVEIRLWALVAEHILPMISAEWPSIFPLCINGPIAFANGD